MKLARMKNRMEGSRSGVQIEWLNPGGRGQAFVKNAPRLNTLEGKTIGEIWNGLFRGPDTFPVLRELIKQRFPTAKIIPYTELPIGFPDTATIGKAVREKGCDAVIVGNGL